MSLLQLLEKIFALEVIPTLVLFYSNGTIITEDGVSRVEQDPHGNLFPNSVSGVRSVASVAHPTDSSIRSVSAVGPANRATAVDSIRGSEGSLKVAKVASKKHFLTAAPMNQPQGSQAVAVSTSEDPVAGQVACLLATSANAVPSRNGNPWVGQPRSVYICPHHHARRQRTPSTISFIRTSRTR